MPALVQAQNPGENGPPASCAAVAVAASVESGRFFANLPAVPRPTGKTNLFLKAVLENSFLRLAPEVSQVA